MAGSSGHVPANQLGAGHVAANHVAGGGDGAVSGAVGRGGLGMTNQADINMLLRSHEAVNANLAALREKLERVQELEVTDRGEGRGRTDGGMRNGGMRSHLNNFQDLELAEVRRSQMNSSQAEARRNMPEKREEGSEESSLLSEKIHLVSKLQELEERKRQMDSLLCQYNQVAALSQQFARADDAGGKGRELRDLKARLRELQDMVTDLDRPSYNDRPEEEEEERVESSLAMLTAQYEKTSHTDEEGSRNLVVPPPMVLLNHWPGDMAGERLQGELREKR